VQRAIEYFHGLEEKTALVLGIGEVGISTAKLLSKSNVKNLNLLCRDPGKYNRKKKFLKATVHYWENINTVLALSDLVISATSAPHCVINKQDVENVFADGKKRLLIDLAVPRDIEPSIKDFHNIELLNIEDLPSGEAELRARLLKSAAKILQERNRVYEQVSA